MVDLPRAHEGDGMTDIYWEYKVLTNSEIMEEVQTRPDVGLEGLLNELGGNRWELVVRDDRCFIFKRAWGV